METKRTMEDLFVLLVIALNEIKKNNVLTNINVIRNETDLPYVVIIRYLKVFERLNKLDINSKVVNTTVNRTIDLTKFDLEIRR